jgi:hypothetical protein
MRANRGKENCLNIFDIDDTLFLSSARTKVMKDGKVIARLRTAELAKWRRGPGEKFDYTEFSSGQTFRKIAVPILKMITRARAIVSGQPSGSKTIIVTARADMRDKDEFLQTFRDHGFPIDQVYVERAGNVDANSHPVKKAFIIRKYLKTGAFKTVRMWDDHHENLDMLLKLNTLHPDINFEAWLVDPKTGSTTRYRGQ